MNVGIIGPKGAGKSLLFHSLTGVHPSASGKIELVYGTAHYLDPRIDVLTELYISRKKVYATVEYIDSPPIETGGFKKANFRQDFLRGMERVDAFLVVVPCFQPGQIDEAADVVKDLRMEFIISDLELVEKRMERLERDIKRGAKEAQKELELITRCKTALENETMLYDVHFSDEEMKPLKSFAFLTMKQSLIVLNISEDDLDKADEIETKVNAQLGGTNTLAICAKVQSELIELPEDERLSFMQELGVSESASDKVIRRTREKLGLITFLTAGEQESHAWDLRKGAPAVEAAGVIHTDMQKGFIRAEVFHYNDIVEWKTEAKLKEKGLIRLEGRDYVVKDGDIMLFRFKV